MKFHAAKDKPCHGVKGPPIFPCGSGRFLFQVVFGVQSGLFTFHLDIGQSTFHANFCFFFPPVFGRVKQDFPIEHIFFPLCFCKCCPPSTYIGGPKGRNSVTENRTFHSGEPPYFFFLSDRPIKFHCKKKKLNLGGTLSDE